MNSKDTISKEAAKKPNTRRSVAKLGRKRTIEETASEGMEFLQRSWGKKKTNLVSRKISERNDKIKESTKTKSNKRDNDSIALKKGLPLGLKSKESADEGGGSRLSLEPKTKESTTISSKGSTVSTKESSKVSKSKTTKRVNYLYC
ncbi:hypothetical protein ACOME3_006008 [Neoechinorhynchus agilis]